MLLGVKAPEATEGYIEGCKRRREKNKAKVKEWAKHIKVPFLHCTERRFYPPPLFVSIPHIAIHAISLTVTITTHHLHRHTHRATD